MSSGVDSAMAQETVNRGVLSHTELSMEVVKTLPFDPSVLNYADTFFTIEIATESPNATEIFEDIYALGITGEERKAVIDGDGIVIVVDSFERYSDEDCQFSIDETSFPLIIHSKTPEICEFTVLYFPNMELTS